MNTTAALKKTKKQLHESGFKLTPQREATLLVLLENEKDHLSAEESLECGSIEEVEEDLLTGVEDIVEKKYHFLVKDHRLTFHGVCQKCQTKNAAKLSEA